MPARAAGALLALIAMLAVVPPAAGQVASGYCVALAQFGTDGAEAMFATDGTDWEAGTSPSGVQWRNGAGGANVFVATDTAHTGTSGAHYSVDGTSWETAETPTSTTGWEGVAFGNGRFVAVANNGGAAAAMYSFDGQVWLASATPGGGETLNDVAWSGDLSLFAAVGGTGTNTVATSPDGITWTARTGIAGTWTGVAWGNGNFTAVGSGGTVMSSPDGISWTARTPAEANTWQDVYFGGGLFVATADTGTNRVMTSPDGASWTARAIAAGAWNAGAYTGSLHVVGRADGGTQRIATSADAITWTLLGATPDVETRDIVCTTTGFSAPSAAGSLVSVARDAVADVFGVSSAVGDLILGIIILAGLMCYGAEIGALGLAALAASGAGLVWRMGLMPLWLVIVVVLLSLSFVAKRLG